MQSFHCYRNDNGSLKASLIARRNTFIESKIFRIGLIEISCEAFDLQRNKANDFFVYSRQDDCWIVKIINIKMDRQALDAQNQRAIYISMYLYIIEAIKTRKLKSINSEL